MKTRKEIYNHGKFGKLMLVVILIMLVGLGICLYILSELDERISYEISEKNTIKFLNGNIDELNDLAQDYLNNPDLESKGYKLISFISYNSSDDVYNKKLENIMFECGYQGMLGGQDWGLLYVPKSEQLKENLYIYDEKKINKTGNNIFIRKRIRKNWFFYYNDFDGRVNLRKLK